MERVTAHPLRHWPEHRGPDPSSGLSMQNFWWKKEWPWDIQTFLFSPVNIIPPVLHIHLHLRSFSEQKGKRVKFRKITTQMMFFRKWGASRKTRT
jgi:hypothetical protein